MRGKRAESREIDLMMRQWTGVQQGLAWAAAALLASVATVAGAQTATRTALSVEPKNTGAVLTAHVTGVAGDAPFLGASRGTVSFDTAAGSLGAALVDADGNATILLTELPDAREGRALAVRATYTPALQGGLAASVSAQTPLPAAAGVPDFAVTLNPATVTTPQGQDGISAVTITPQNGFSEQVTLSCSNLPAQVTCTFSPVIQTTASGAFTSTLQLQTQAASGAVLLPDFGTRPPGIAWAWLLPGALALAGLGVARRRAWRGAALLLLAVAAGAGLGGCSQRYGYIHHPPSVAPGTPKGTYPITVSASGNDGSAVTIHTMTLTLTVN